MHYTEGSTKPISSPNCSESSIKRTTEKNKKLHLWKKKYATYRHASFKGNMIAQEGKHHLFSQQ